MATKAERRVSQSDQHDKLQLPQDQDVNSIIYVKMKIPGTFHRSEDIAGACTERLVAKIDDAIVSKKLDTIRWGNPAGLSILENQDALLHTVEQLQKKDRDNDARFQRQDARFGQLESENQVFQTELGMLKVTSEKYLEIRSRFFATYIRDKIGNNRMSGDDWKVIKKADQDSHHGDALTDATLYKLKLRKDITTYRALYVISPEQVLDHLSKENNGSKAALKILNAHATVKADKKFVAPNSFYESFSWFTDALESNGWRNDYLQEESASETQAHGEFWNEYNAIKGKPRK